MTSNLRDGFTIPMPKPGDGTKIFANRDGSLTCSWDRPPAPRMAMDADPFSNPSSPVNSPFDNGDPEGDDLADKIHQLLDGKLDDADIETLIEMIQQPQAQPIAGDSRRGLAHDEMQRRVSYGQALRAQATASSLVKRFPALKNARVIG